jgi:hypothetical protein
MEENLSKNSPIDANYESLEKLYKNQLTSQEVPADGFLQD